MTPPSIVFRVDASVEIGSGHVMRCLTLADVLGTRGYACHFISRAHVGHLGPIIERRGHRVHLLPGGSSPRYDAPSAARGQYADWLSVLLEQDARETAAVVAELNPEWLVVDHYALDVTWERDAATGDSRIMIIDDLANRTHDCHLLLDQTFGRAVTDYATLVPPEARLLCGSAYALLRPAFSALRTESLLSRSEAPVRRILISMGGADADNLTGQILDAVDRTSLPEGCQITVIMGFQSPWLEDVRRRAERSRLSIDVLAGVEDMARVMADCDFAIGAAGATSWERCCLGLPTIMFVLADNQRTVAAALGATGAAIVLAPEDISCLPDHVLRLCQKRTLRAAMSARAAEVTDGRGAWAVADVMESSGVH